MPDEEEVIQDEATKAKIHEERQKILAHFQALTGQQQEEQREIWTEELSILEDEIAQLKIKLGTKLNRRNHLRLLLGFDMIKKVAKKSVQAVIPRWRYYLVMLILASLPILLLVKIAQLQILPSQERGVDFLQHQGDSRAIRNVTIPAYRGLITDRNGEPLAISTPVTAIVANPKNIQKSDIERLSLALKISESQLQSRLQRYRNKSFMYLVQQLPNDEAEKILKLNIPGVSGQQRYKRFYPAGEVTAQLVGFTNYLDIGQEGMELAYDDWLTGEPGKKKVVLDKNRRVINDISLIQAASSGEDLRLSIDLRVQYAAYRALKKAVKKHNAKSGSVLNSSPFFQF